MEEASSLRRSHFRREPSSGPLQTITGIITGLTMGCTVLLGQNIGRKDMGAAARTIGSSVALQGILSTFLVRIPVSYFTF